MECGEKNFNSMPEAWPSICFFQSAPPPKCKYPRKGGEKRKSPSPTATRPMLSYGTRTRSRRISSSAICTVFRAAPLRILSRHDPKVQSVGDGFVFADTAHESIVLACGLNGHGIDFLRRIIQHGHARRPGNRITRASLGRDLFHGLDIDGLAVAVKTQARARPLP